MALNKLNGLTQNDKDILEKLKYDGSYSDADNKVCLFASNRQILVDKKVPEDTIGRFMRSREALPIDDIIKICKEVYSRKYLKLLDILVEIFNKLYNWLNCCKLLVYIR